MATRLIELIQSLPRTRVVLVGDFMLDRYIFGRTDRVSPEAPIPVLRYAREERRLGGAGFVAAALAALGAEVLAVGAIGDDEAGAMLRGMLEARGIDAGGLLAVAGRPTVEKVRLLGASEDRTPQQMIRLDIEEPSALSASAGEAVLAHARQALRGDALLCIEDYDKGVVAAEVCAALIAEARRAGRPAIVDPARLSDYSKYRGATALKFNRTEAQRASGRLLGDDAGLAAAAAGLVRSLDLEAAIITLNDRGSYLATRDGGGELLSSRPRQVADATGAGDMVLATLCVARCAGASWHEAVMLANAAGGLEVERLGCVPLTPAEIAADLLRDAHAGQGKLRTRETLSAEVARHRAAGRRIVFTNGCFDIVHLGHVKYFQFAKAQGDVLIVGVNTDAGIRRLKGPKRPVIPEADRLGVLEELESIDYLVPFDEDTPIELIRAVRPDVLVKGADYRKEQVVGWDLVESAGGRVALAPLVDGRSTTSVIERILDAYGSSR